MEEKSDKLYDIWIYAIAVSFTGFFHSYGFVYRTFGLLKTSFIMNTLWTSSHYMKRKGVIEIALTIDSPLKKYGCI